MADKHFLDYDGLSQFFNGLKQKFYQKPSSGIPKSDLASSVRDSLGRADSALQSHQDISGKLDKSGGTMTGAINMGNKNIGMLGDPTQDTDAANKKYVDDTIGKKLVIGATQPSDTTAIWVSTIDRKIKCYDAQSSSWIQANPIDDGSITTAKIADGNVTKAKLASAVQTSLTKADNALPKSGGTMTGAINMGSKKITSLGTPTSDADAATKKYVDDAVSSGGVVSSVNGKNGAVVLGPHDLSFPNDFVVEPFRTRYVDEAMTILYSTAETLASGIEDILTDLDGKATTSYVDNAISTAVASAVVYKGTKAAVANLPSTGNKTGDMWNVSADGMNYVWDGSKWDAQAPTFSITAITTAEINAILASTT